MIQKCDADYVSFSDQDDYWLENKIEVAVEKLENIKGPALYCSNQILVGYRNKDLFLEEDLAKYGNVYIATEDGSVGTKGNVRLLPIYANRLPICRCHQCHRCPRLSFLNLT